jgi:hypothetical protein
MAWFDNGNILDFTRRNPGINRLEIVRMISLRMNDTFKLRI